MPHSRRCLLVGLGGGLISAALLLGCRSNLQFFLLTGRFAPQQIIEPLQNPVAITGWSETGLLTTDGTIVPVAGMARLPSDSLALQSAKEHGVELSTDGR